MRLTVELLPLVQAQKRCVESALILSMKGHPFAIGCSGVAASAPPPPPPPPSPPLPPPPPPSPFGSIAASTRGSVDPPPEPSSPFNPDESDPQAARTNHSPHVTPHNLIPTMFPDCRAGGEHDRDSD